MLGQMMQQPLLISSSGFNDLYTHTNSSVPLHTQGNAALVPEVAHTYTVGAVLTPDFLPGFTFCGSMLMSYVTKRIFKRVRPVREHGTFGHRMKDGSFPSGHSLTSWCFWLMLAVAVEAFGAGTVLVLAITAVGLAIPLLTGLSRVYLGVHFPSDVLGGYTIGAVWSLVCYFALLPVL